MGKAVAYLVAIALFILLLRATGLLDGIFSRGNLQEREAFWQQTVGAEAPAGSTQQTVEAIVARSGVSLECFASSLSPPVTECRGDDPSSKGGTSAHPVALQLNFTFHGERLAKFETSMHVLQ